MDSSALKQMGLDAALVLAAEGDDCVKIQLLMAAGANPKAAPLRGESALMAAAKAERLEATRILLPLSDLSQLNSAGQSPLNLAATRTSSEVVRLLLPHFDPDHVAHSGDNALMSAARRGVPEVVTALLERADPNARGKNQRSALHVAAAEGSERATLALLARSDPNALDEHGDTALVHAMENGWADIAETLAPLTDVLLKNHDGYSALDIARYSQHLESFESAKLCDLIGELQRKQAALQERSEIGTATTTPGRLGGPAIRV